MVGMQAKCACGMSVTIPRQSVPETPIQQVAPQPAPAFAGYSAPQKQAVTGVAFSALSAYEIAAGIVGAAYAWPVYKQVAAFIDLFSLAGGAVFGRWEAWFGMLWVLASMTLVAAAVAVLCRQDWGAGAGRNRRLHHGRFAGSGFDLWIHPGYTGRGGARFVGTAVVGRDHPDRTLLPLRTGGDVGRFSSQRGPSAEVKY